MNDIYIPSFSLSRKEQEVSSALDAEECAVYCTFAVFSIMEEWGRSQLALSQLIAANVSKQFCIQPAERDRARRANIQETSCQNPLWKVFRGDWGWRTDAEVMVLHERGVNMQVTRLKIASAIAGLRIRVRAEINEEATRQKHFMRDPLQRHWYES